MRDLAVSAPPLDRQPEQGELVGIRDLYKSYPVVGSAKVLVAVAGVNFTINRGDRLGLVGESGSGKTTVGRCLLRLVEPTAGSIFFDGVDITRLSTSRLRAVRPKMQMVFQDPFDSLDPHMALSQIVSEPLLQDRSLSRNARSARVADALHDVELSSKILRSRPKELSAGAAQRVGIARAIVTNPSLVVLDEPTSALDLVSRGRILDVLLRLQHERDLTYLFISHDLNSVRHFCNRIVVMYLGAIVEEGPADEVFRHPHHPYTKALLSAFLPADPDSPVGTYKLRGEIPSPIDRPPGCPLVGRCPEQIDVCPLAFPPLTEIMKNHRVACYVAGSPHPQRPATATTPRESAREGLE